MKEKILLVSSHLPYPGILHGGGQRVLRLARALAPRFRVDLVAYHAASEAGKAAELRQGWEGELVALPKEEHVRWPLPDGWARRALHLASPAWPDDVLAFRSEAARRELRRLAAAGGYRAAIVEFPEMAGLLDDLPRGACRVLSTHECRSEVQRYLLVRERRPLWLPYRASQWLKTRRLERTLYPRYDLVLAVAPRDLERFARSVPSGKLALVPNGVLLESHPYKGIAGTDRRRDAILYVANFRSAANVEGLRWLAAEVLPRVRARVPGARLWVAAADLPAELRSLHRPGELELLGPFEDLRPISWEARAAVAPIFLDTGMNHKIAEAMAFGLPVVATEEAARGVDGRGVLAAGTPEGFAAHLVRLLTDDAFAEERSRLGRRAVEEHFDLARALDALAERLERWRAP